MGKFISYKLLAQYLGERQRSSIVRQAFTDLNAEAWQVTRAILFAAKASAEKIGAIFSVAVFPNFKFIGMARRNQTDRDSWQEMVADLNRHGFHTMDLLPTLLLAPSNLLDAGYDGSHYGPKTSDTVAKFLGAALAASVAREKTKGSVGER